MALPVDVPADAEIVGYAPCPEDGGTEDVLTWTEGPLRWTAFSCRDCGRVELKARPRAADIR